MKILHINTYDIMGGAAKAAYRLHQGLRYIGQDSSMFVNMRKGNDPHVVAFSPPMDFLIRFRRRMRREFINHSISRYRKSRPQGYDVFSDNRTEYGNTVLSQLPSCDIINLHWIAGFVDYQSFLLQRPKNIPLVWTLHDMNAFTGGCHYTQGCHKYNDECGACPQLGSNNKNDLSRKLWKLKRDVFSRLEPEQLHIVALNKWMYNEVKDCVLLNKFPVTIIPNGLDTKAFSPRDKRLAREAFELPNDLRIILYIADLATNHRKGITLLTEALNNIDNPNNLLVISVGRGKPIFNKKISHIHLGNIENDRLLSLIYSAPDLFIISSIQDNLPNTVLEAMACGTPIVGFEVGGIPDMVRPGITGILAPSQDVGSLRTAITDLIQDDVKLKEMAINCRRIAVEEYSMKVQACRYIQLYNQILH